ncbi:hypothetical protein [Actinomyces qiguomingii]|uniref:hypothetical protein n=1 Tax=Actinomyces qiguomingii TaxID=2057800 RepID=UPI000CA05505|nr:hypothetical protein [Actinomyces qiguomingii]
MHDERDEAAVIVERIDELRMFFRRRTQINDRFVYLLLAATYVLGFGGQYALLQVSPTVGGAGWIVAIVGMASLLMIFTHSFKQYRGVHGHASRRPAIFGTAWLIGLILTASISTAAAALLRLDSVEHVAYGTSCILMGAIYAFSGTYLNNSLRERGLGLWLIAVGVVGMLLGMPLMLPTIGILSGAGFLFCALTTRPPGHRTLSTSPTARARH